MTILVQLHRLKQWLMHKDQHQKSIKADGA
jgi:hypothetical protein